MRKMLGLGLLALTLVGCSHDPNPWEGMGGPPRVLTSFPPLYSLAKSVAGDDAAVKSLLTNQGPHDYEFHSRDVLTLREADVFFVNGLTLDDKFAEKMKNSCGNKNLHYVELCNAVPKERWINTGKEIKHGNHTHGSSDPHLWLGIPEAIDMVKAIRDELQKVDPTHAAGYAKRAEATIAELQQLQKDGDEMFKGKKIKIVSFHGALNYFARSFGLRVTDTIQVDPGREVPDGELLGIAKRAANEGVNVLAIEPQYPQSERVAADVAQRIGKLGMPVPTIITIDPLETAEAKELDAGWYVRKMRENIDTLAGAVK